MGSEQGQRGRGLSYYGQQMHSVEGEVAVYRLKGEALYIFGKEGSSPEICNVAKVISTLRCRFLCGYVGQLLEEQTECSGDCSCLREDTGKTFWSYQNYTLRQEMQHNNEEGKFPAEDQVWSLLAELAQASSILISHRLFVDCTLDNVHLSPLKNHQLYWGNAKVGNGHRLYYRMLMGEERTESGMIMSPEELRVLRKGKISARIDLQKCVMHSLGVLAVLYANSLPNYSHIYGSERQEIKQTSLTALISHCRQRYSHKLTTILTNMVQQSPSRRPSFHSLFQESQSFTLLHSSGASSIQKLPPELQTCGSSKVSVRPL